MRDIDKWTRSFRGLTSRMPALLINFFFANSSESTVMHPTQLLDDSSASKNVATASEFLTTAQTTAGKKNSRKGDM
jgi:hypothetical protein